MGADTLIDTGAILAILDKDDSWHSACSDILTRIRLPMLTSPAILTELFHLIEGRAVELEAAWGFIRAGGISLAPIGQADLPSLNALMLRYHDRPMDFADATLVHIAERESITSIFTVDHNDFETYRIGGRRRFRVVPERGYSGPKSH